MPLLVNVFLRGAADGLSLLAPVGDPAYYAARPTQALAVPAVIDVGIDGFGLHPAMPQLAELTRSGRVALVPAAGYGGQTRSHFQSQAILETAVGDDGAGTSGAGLGWLASLLAAGGSRSASPFRGVAVGSVSVPPSMWGSDDTLGVPDPTTLRLGALRPARRKRGSYRVLDSQLAPDPSALQQAWLDDQTMPPITTRGVSAAVGVLDRAGADPIAITETGAFGDGPTAATFAAASAIIDAGLDTEVVQIDLGGWDTHKSQGTVDGTFADLAAGLDAGLGGLFARHGGSVSGKEGGLDGGLVVTVMSEFGRRLQENASGGTDHGRGGLALVIGDDVAGGLHGTWPGLAELADGDVQAVNDLRVLQSEVAMHVFGAKVPVPADAAPLNLFV